MRLGCWKSSYIITSRGSLRSRWPLRVRCECQRLRAFCCCSPFYFPARFVASDWDSMWWAPTTWRFLPRLYPLHTRFLQSEKRLKCPRHSVSLIPRTDQARCCLWDSDLISLYACVKRVGGDQVNLGPLLWPSGKNGFHGTHRANRIDNHSKKTVLLLCEQGGGARVREALFVLWRARRGRRARMRS